VRIGIESRFGVGENLQTKKDGVSLNG
jgi:hypothetical protein